MDSLSQIALGAAISTAVMGRRTAVWKAALWGGVAGTLPDLDALIDYGDPIRNMVFHRAETHALFWLALFALPFSALVAWLNGQWALRWRWLLAMALVLLTHPLLDTLTIYGTQLALPFTNYPFGVGSIFIIDLLYTLPLLLGMAWALIAARRKAGGQDSNSITASAIRGLKANALGLAISCAYLLWSVLVQQHVQTLASKSLAAQGITAQSVLVTPAPLNTVLWRVVAVADNDTYHEGFYSLLDASPQIVFNAYPRGNALAAEVAAIDGVQRLQAFTKGFYALRVEGSQVLISDLRMGQEPDYAFTFAVASKSDGPAAAIPLEPPQQVGGRGNGNLRCSLSWLRQRVMGTALPPTAEFCKNWTPKT